MSDSVFKLYSKYYDLLYKSKDYVAETNYVVELLKRYDVSGKNLLEFGSGTGVHGRLLAERGYQVIGIERSDEMVAQAESTSGFTSQQGDICTVQLGRSFDVVLSLFHVISYQTTNESVQAVFSRAAEHLDSGGLFVFDVWYSAAVYVQKPEVRVKRMKDDAIEITRIAEPVVRENKNCVDVNYNIFVRDLKRGTVETMSEIHAMRHFSLPELDMFANNTGFERVGAEEFLTGNTPGGQTWGLCVIMKKS